MKVLVLIVAFNAESTLSGVLDRIPGSVLLKHECEVLVIDDASSDRTFAVGLEYRQSRPDLPLTVLRNPANQGYGGNQKLGYSYAIAHGFDVVALVHGDGQYAPEELPRLLQPIADGTADAVFGSRMMRGATALRGGMPFYKFVGNKMLTATQNLLSRSGLSEWHSGYRLYSTDLLRRIRFESNSNGFSFDTEIILQVLNADGRLVELPIPTHYGDEICRVNGLQYAGEVLTACFRNALHRAGVFQRRSLSPIEQVGNSHYDLKLGFRSSHTEVLKRVPAGSRVLDLGAGPGAFAVALANAGAIASTADKFRPAVLDPRVQAHTMDLDQGVDLDLSGYDQILMLDVIEHLRDPETFLEDLRFELGAQPRELILTTPNIAFVITRLMLAMGQFNYGSSGILDRTHTRLFTFRTLKTMVRDAGFEVHEVQGIPAPFPKVVGDGLLGRGLLALNYALIKVAPRLFSYQVLLRASSRPHAHHVLAHTAVSTAELVA
ncbi:MAG: bifunctional glycosyltransferase/class I SAM-dependent methyltransferase [Pedococcus sp.]